MILENHKLFQSGSMWYQTAKLSNDDMSYLHQSIQSAKESNINLKHKLAGNITQSIQLPDNLNLFTSKILPAFYINNQQNINTITQKAFKSFCSDGCEVEFHIPPDQLGVNFQNKTEFNPLHSHSGALSFVVWVDIPYDWEHEKELLISKGSTCESKVGNFVFYYHNGHDIVNNIVRMTPKLNGTMALFPAWVTHCVYPFYTTDQTRVSISGNVVFNPINGE